MEMRHDPRAPAISLISKIRRLSGYCVVSGCVLAILLAFIDASSYFFYLLIGECAVLIVGGLWTFLYPGKTGVLANAIAHSLLVLMALPSRFVLLGAGAIIAVLYFIYFNQLRKTPVTREDIAHFRELKKRFSRSNADMIRIMVITFVEKRIWKCVLEKDRLLIRGQYGGEIHACRPGDISILGSNAHKPWFNIKFTIRMNGEIYRCKASRRSYHKLDIWIREGQWKSGN